MKTGRFFRRLRVMAAALFFAVAFAAFLGCFAAARAMRIEFAPALLQGVAAFTLGALAVLLVLALLTWIFGRFYCAALCPLGIWQDAVGWAACRRGRPEPDRPRIRLLVAGFSFGALAAGWTLPFMLVDPYSNFGRAVAGGFALGGLLPLAVVTLLALWKKRLYCTTICPVGTLLGFLSGRGVWRLTIKENCVKCGQCVKNCPSGCIDIEAGTLDNGRCVRCLNCLAVCRLHAVKFAVTHGAALPHGVPDRSRRRFLIDGGILLAALAAGAAAGHGARQLIGIALGDRLTPPILPPGAGDFARFAAKCTACQLCTANCPAGIIVPAPGGCGPVRLDLSRGACRYDCDKCSAVCPTGALVPLGLEKKRRTRIAEARFDAAHCIVCQELKKCGNCAAACPTGAIRLRGKLGVPQLNADKCIGCGACQAACPADPQKAMTVHPAGSQTTIEKTSPTVEV